MHKHRILAGLIAFGLTAAVLLSQGRSRAQELDKRLAEGEKKRIELIKGLKPTVVCVMGRDPRTKNVIGLGSGVLIDPEGYALTNFHVVSAIPSPVMQCGLSDGKLYDAVLVGTDMIGDISLIKLLPAKPDQKFPAAKIGDSDKAKAGEWSLLMGNPFGLAYDFQPTVTFGIISATNRYQNVDGRFEYANFLQVDTSANPGNSGGPLFNTKGELIGILGAGPSSRRVRMNSGAGFCISINMVKNFLPGLMAGLPMDHATLGAAMESESDEGALSRVLVKNVIDSDAQRRGLEVGDELIFFAGQRVRSVNHFKNLLGQYPRGWRVPIVWERERKRSEALVRLMGSLAREIEEAKGGGPGGPPGKMRPPVAPPSGPAAKLYVAKKGFANYYFNDLAQKRVLKAFAENGDFSTLKGDWTLRLGGRLLAGIGKPVTGAVAIREKGAADGVSPKVLADIDGLDFPLEPLSTKERSEAFKDPPGSGGFLLAMYHYRQFLVYGAKGFDKDQFAHAGLEPFFPPMDEKPNYMKERVMAEAIHTKHAGVAGRWYFAMEDDKARGWKKGQLIGMEITPDKDEDSCELCFSEYKDVGGGKLLPGKMHVRKGLSKYADFTITAANLK